MNLNSHKDIKVEGKHGRPFLLDYFYPKTIERCPVVVFVHGYKGFKDWGCWERIAEAFAEAGFLFIKFNFAFNGTSVDAPLDFVDLSAFAENNYSKELSDIDVILDFVEALDRQGIADASNISLIGHSRGGGISLVKASLDERIKKVVGWASVARLDYAWQKPEFIENWKKDGKYEVINGRTKQVMPHHYQWYEDFVANGEIYSQEKALPKIKCPILLVHGDGDLAVPVSAAYDMQTWNPTAKVHVIDGADHVFGASHPYEGKELPRDTQELVEVTIDFLNYR